ncbi:MAG: hypothetical protein IJ078_11175 [Succinivibrionaceae bacterium]|nr:hypothetical protein [Succinivibrionaceae bacterium]
MHVNDRLSIYLRHLPFGCVSTLLEVNSVQYICPLSHVQSATRQVQIFEQQSEITFRT